MNVNILLFHECCSVVKTVMPIQKFKFCGFYAWKLHLGYVVHCSGVRLINFEHLEILNVRQNLYAQVR